MTGSLIHSVFDPLPYVLFSLAAIATGLLIELRTTIRGKGRPSGVLPRRPTGAEGRAEPSPRPSHPRDCPAH